MFPGTDKHTDRCGLDTEAFEGPSDVGTDG